MAQVKLKPHPVSLDDGLVSGHLVKSGQILDLMGICSTYEYIGP